jgi:hypothetical protein
VTVRATRPTTAYARGLARLVSTAGTRTKLAACVRELADDPELPGPGDLQTLMPPTRVVYVRQAPGLALWIWYGATLDVLTLYALTDAPPP